MAAIAFDFEDVVPTVQRAHRHASRDDAEEAVQTAVAEGIEKGWDLTARNVVACARFRLLSAKERREAHNLSLDAFTESDVDEAPVELAVAETDFDSHVQLGEAAENPILRRRIAAAKVGTAELRRRGAAAVTRGKAWPDETVAKVRRLRAEGVSYAEVTRRTGVPPTTISNWTTGGFREAPTADTRWSRELIREAIRAYVAEEGRLPNTTDSRDPRLPSARTVQDFYPDWAAALADLDA